MQNPSKEEIKQILVDAKTIAIVGLSDNPDRISYQVAKRMQSYGYKIIPVNPMIKEALGEKAVATLTEIKEPVDIINVFRRVDQIMPVAEEAVEYGQGKVFWMQLGLVHEEAAALCKQHGMSVIMDYCIKVAYAELIQS
ncbi:CoA-binding protein [Ammoniphilus oxalaticus]|nr:CoA-binding protein [Ammoniphilus oxalaticus]